MVLPRCEGRHRRLWWANLVFVVLPAALATAAAVFAAQGAAKRGGQWAALLAAFLAGGAAVLASIHKALKCEEYQAECLRLSQAYKSIAISADALTLDQAQLGSLEDFKKKYEVLTESAKAPLPKGYIAKAEKLISEQIER